MMAARYGKNTNGDRREALRSSGKLKTFGPPVAYSAFRTVLSLVAVLREINIASPWVREPYQISREPQVVVIIIGYR
jgi:hypothetical protein